MLVRGASPRRNGDQRCRGRGAVAGGRPGAHSWQVEKEERPALPPALAAPEIGALGAKGFGAHLIERACTYELEAEVELDYASDGLRCEMVFPLASRCQAGTRKDPA
jgi:hypothetical protein